MAKSIESQLRELERKLNPIINKAMHEDMYRMLESLGKEAVQKVVYDEYIPIGEEYGGYDRTGKLKNESWAKNELNQGLVFKNIRKDEETGKYIPSVIETGKGYDFTGNPPFPYEKPRPFMGTLAEWLRDDKHHVEVMKWAMENAGFKVTT